MKHFFVFILFLLTVSLFSQNPPEALWTQTYGGPNYDEAYSVQQITDGGYIVAGYTRSYGAGGSDFWLIRLSVDTDSEDEIISNEPFQLSNHPNPFNPEMVISFQGSGFSNQETNIEIYNVKGQKTVTLSGVEGSVNNNIASSPSSFDSVQDDRLRMTRAGSKLYSVIWNGTDAYNQPVSSGIYFYKLKAGNFERIRKMILLR